MAAQLFWLCMHGQALSFSVYSSNQRAQTVSTHANMGWLIGLKRLHDTTQLFQKISVSLICYMLNNNDRHSSQKVTCQTAIYYYPLLSH